jgi:hypothetical protein
MQMYEELDASFAPKVDEDYRQIQKGMEAAPREVVQRALDIEPQISAASMSEQKATRVPQRDGVENSAEQIRSGEPEPAGDALKGKGPVQAGVDDEEDYNGEGFVSESDDLTVYGGSDGGDDEDDGDNGSLLDPSSNHPAHDDVVDDEDDGDNGEWSSSNGPQQANVTDGEDDNGA